MADLTTAVEIVARAHFEDANTRFGVKELAWEDVPAAAKHAYKEEFLVGITALHEAGMLKEDSDG